MRFSILPDVLGSPPPMRGKVNLPLFKARLLRITPAHAGKRTLDNARSNPHQDHPRPCGEKRAAAFVALRRFGSPPPMRGKDTEDCGDELEQRITPAHAGKSYVPPVQHLEARDHPRPCGEKYYGR